MSENIKELEKTKPLDLSKTSWEKLKSEGVTYNAKEGFLMPFTIDDKTGAMIFRSPKHILMALHNIRKAATMLYFAGHWGIWSTEGGITDEQQASLWEQMRDALEFPPGTWTQVEKEMEKDGR